VPIPLMPAPEAAIYAGQVLVAPAPSSLRWGHRDSTNLVCKSDSPDQRFRPGGTCSEHSASARVQTLGRACHQSRLGLEREPTSLLCIPRPKAYALFGFGFTRGLQSSWSRRSMRIRTPNGLVGARQPSHRGNLRPSAKRPSRTTGLLRVFWHAGHSSIRS